ncbi:hypothetical protein [Chromatium okenii]|jgi:hypothetical protein|uniref:hypothetical protein n=1 Tax=Chromatium okenii TaxID=61644 RepID=UPI0026F23D76|nr:hypothetical protein [Chromatium okenii]MBV5310813.1 hypothetical protein [Chromatium okenii]
MAQALLELRKLLARETARRGRVVKVGAKSVQVATATGMVTALANSDFAVGQEVSVSDGVAYAVAVASAVYAL